MRQKTTIVPMIFSNSYLHNMRNLDLSQYPVSLRSSVNIEKEV